MGTQKANSITQSKSIKFTKIFVQYKEIGNLICNSNEIFLLTALKDVCINLFKKI